MKWRNSKKNSNPQELIKKNKYIILTKVNETCHVTREIISERVQDEIIFKLECRTILWNRQAIS
jgi:hypothetical protein